MSELLEFRSPIPVDTPLGRGHALFVETDSHIQHWTVIINKTRAFVTFPQDKILAVRSYTYGRSMTDMEMQEIISRAAGALRQETAGPTLTRNKPRVRSRKR